MNQHATLKKGLIFSLFLFTINTVFAQLTVNSSNYIFVTDEVLFVQDDIELKTANSRIHLRDDAQLLQGTGTTGNSGDGILSVQQNGTVNQYAYNYWCSPVGRMLAGNGNNTFRASLFDESTGTITSTNAAFTSSLNGLTSPLTISNAWIYTYVASTNYADWVYSGQNGDIAPGLGFTMKGTDHATQNQLYEFRGRANNGTISNTVANGEWTLVGNPYPSALDAVDFIHDTDNVNSITGTLYYWEQAPGANSHNIADYVGGYATYTIASDGTGELFTPATFNTYNGDGSINTVGASSATGKAAKRYIPIGQGFMVEGNSAVNTLVYTRNSHRDYYKQSGTESFFFRLNTSENSNTNNSNEDETVIIDSYGYPVHENYMRFRLNVDINETYTRQLLMNFTDTATDGFDYGMEGKHPDVLASDAHWTIENEPYVIQSLAFDQNVTIPLILKLNQQQNVQFRIFDVIRFDDSQPIYLHDIQEELYVDLRTQDHMINLDAGDYTNRFEITFTQDSTLDIKDHLASTLAVIQDNNASQLIIKNPNFLDITSFQLYDTANRRVFNYSNVGNEINYRYSTQSLSEGVYIAQINLENNQSVTKKIIVKNKN